MNAFAPGFEKTFFDGSMSFELRAPMATTLDHNIYFDNTTRTSVGEFGDLGMVFKTLLAPERTVRDFRRLGDDGAHRPG